MLIGAAFPSKYIKAADLQGQTLRLAIANVVVEDIGNNEHKPVVYFAGWDKGMVLNKTNANHIAAYLGDETTAWTGHQIAVYSTKVEFRGDYVDGIRIKFPAPDAAAPAPTAAPVAQPAPIAPAMPAPTAAPVAQPAPATPAPNVEKGDPMNWEA
jgi:hypothetical protein